MYLSELRIQNFRQFGGGDVALTIRLNKGITALVGQNDAGKSTVIDAIRYALLTRDQEPVRIQPEDFHIRQDGQQAIDVYIRCKLSDLTLDEKGAFAEYLSYQNGDVALYVNWTARKLSEMPGSRRWVDVSVRSGVDGTGLAFETSVRMLLSAAYLRPLRDAEREMSPGRGSRLSEILANVPEIKQGNPFDESSPPIDEAAVAELSLVGLSDYLRHNVQKHKGVTSAQQIINERYLASLSLQRDSLKGKVAFSEGGTEPAKLRQILEHLQLGLFDGATGFVKGRSGLGSNNLLFMACELLLLGKEPDGLALLLIEEPEAHLHPQRQLRLMEFLRTAANGQINDVERAVQVIVTTHSPNLASKIPLANMVLLDGKHSFSFAPAETKLETGDYRFLERFLDVTKANLFFSHGVIIVEGDAEAILIPTLAKLIGKDFTAHGVSIVNVGGTGLRRFSRIFQRRDISHGVISIPVACITDIDVMPDCAPEILGLVENEDDPKWGNPRRRWRAMRDLGSTSEERDEALAARRTKLSEDDKQRVRTFVADYWTLEYDLAYCGLAEEVFIAASLAKNEDPLNGEKKNRTDVEAAAKVEFTSLENTSAEDRESLCTAIYRLFQSEGASKAISAQYLAAHLLSMAESGHPNGGTLRSRLPRYLVNAIDYVTSESGAAVISLSSAGEINV